MFFQRAVASSVVSSHEFYSHLKFYIPWICQKMLAGARDFCKSIADTLGFFFASLSILHCAVAVIFTGEPLLGRITTVLNFLFIDNLCGLDWWTSRLMRYFCNPFQLYASQQFLIVGLLRTLLCQAWFTSGNASWKLNIENSKLVCVFF